MANERALVDTHIGGQAAVTTRSTVMAGAVGHFIEWYDWTIYGLLSAVFASQMFPSHDPIVALLAAYGTFAAGFLMRPVGSLVLSPLADRYGRRGVLALTIVLAGIGSLMVAIAPTYAQAGLLAPVMLLAARLLQGFATGGEYQTAAAFLNEHAKRERRAFAASSQMVSTGLAILFAMGVAALTTWAFPKEMLDSWGWRVPFFLGAALSLYGVWLRRAIPETPTFEAKASREPISLRSIFAGFIEYPKESLIVVVIQASGVQFYLWMVFLATYANLAGGLPISEGLFAGMISLGFYTVIVSPLAALSDRIGRKPMLIGSALGFLILVYPMLQMLKSGDFTTFLIIQMAGVFLIAMNNSVIGTVFSEIFPTRLRATGIGLPYAICVAVFGGTSPLIATYFIKSGQDQYIAYYVMVICLISVLVHLFITPETKGKDLD
jgi:MHS family alpha-ketoglutarate permease-like MFS transporter